MKMCKKYLNGLINKSLSPYFSLCWEGGSCDQLVRGKEDRTDWWPMITWSLNSNIQIILKNCLKKKSNFFLLQWEKWSECDDAGEAHQREEKRDAAEAETLRGVKSNMNVEHERAITKQKIQRKKLVKEGRRKRKRLREKNGQKQKRRERKDEMRGCCSARIKARSLSCPTFPQKSEEKKKIQTLKHKLKCFSLWPVFPITATRTLCKLRSQRHLISFLLFTLYASSLLSFLLLCLHFAHQLR